MSLKNNEFERSQKIFLSPIHRRLMRRSNLRVKWGDVVDDGEARLDDWLEQFEFELLVTSFEFRPQPTRPALVEGSIELAALITELFAALFSTIELIAFDGCTLLASEQFAGKLLPIRWPWLERPLLKSFAFSDEQVLLLLFSAFCSSNHLSCDRRRAFMKKLPTVDRSRPSCWLIVICISFVGLFVSLWREGGFGEN